MVKNTKKMVIIYAIILSLFIIPIGNTLVSHRYIINSVSNILFTLIALFSPFLFITNLILSRKTEHFHKWYKLYLVFIILNISICISNYFPFLSAMSNLGYIHMAPADIILRIIVMVICFKYIYKWMKGAYQSSEHPAGEAIVRTFAITQIILFSIAAFGNYFALLR